MYLLGHLGIGLGTAWLLTAKSGRSVDYRLVLFGAILPDLIDKPLGFLLGLESRLWAHTLVFFGTVLAVSAVPSLRRVAALALGVATHLVLDRIWDMPYVVLWPALGVAFPPDRVDFLGLLEVLLTDPVVLGGELVGGALLVAFARAHGIRSWSALKRFLRDGTTTEATSPEA